MMYAKPLRKPASSLLQPNSITIFHQLNPFCATGTQTALLNCMAASGYASKLTAPNGVKIGLKR